MENIYGIVELTRMTGGEFSRNFSPVISFTFVQVDGTLDYVAGSLGKIKEIKEYSDIAKIYLKTTTTFKYQDVLFPTQATEIVVI